MMMRQITTDSMPKRLQKERKKTISKSKLKSQVIDREKANSPLPSLHNPKTENEAQADEKKKAAGPTDFMLSECQMLSQQIEDYAEGYSRLLKKGRKRLRKIVRTIEKDNLI